MNDLARETLTQAALDGVRQIKGWFKDDRGGFCALGVLKFNLLCVEKWCVEKYGLSAPCMECPECGALYTEPGLVVHLNDDHNWDFLMIASKFPREGLSNVSTERIVK